MKAREKTLTQVGYGFGLLENLQYLHLSILWVLPCLDMIGYNLILIKSGWEVGSWGEITTGKRGIGTGTERLWLYALNMFHAYVYLLLFLGKIKLWYRIPLLVKHIFKSWIQKEHNYKQKPRLLKTLEGERKQKLLLRPDGRGSLREKLHGRHCCR